MAVCPIHSFGKPSFKGFIKPNPKLGSREGTKDPGDWNPALDEEGSLVGKIGNLQEM